MIRPVALAALLALLPFATSAADVVIGLGYSDFSADGAKDGAIAELELHSDPLWHFAGADWSVGGAMVLHTHGDFFIGVGPSAIWPLRNRWFVEANVMPGYFDDSGGTNSLGSDFEVRSLLGIGRQINDRVSVSLAVTHKSNAGTSDRNPGVNALTLRTRWSF